jgi:cytohesin
VNARRDDGWTPLHSAAFSGRKEIAELLIAKGANVNAKAKGGDTPLDAADRETAALLRKHGGKHGTIHGAAGGGDIEAVKEFLAAGTDVNATNEWGVTPLHSVATKEIAELLIAKGAEVNAKNNDGYTPLHWAASGGHKEIAELLIANGADVNAKDDDGETPLDFAEEVWEDDSPENKAAKKEAANLLRKHGGKTGEELKAEGK